VFYQNDSFGLSGLDGVKKALARRKLSLAAKGAFERNTLAVQAGLSAVMPANPDAVIIVAPYQPSAAFIRAAHEAALKASFSTISFVGTENLIASLGKEAEGIVISQVVPSPADAGLPLVHDYQAALKQAAANAAPSYVSLEGYVTGRVVLAALERAGREVTRESLVSALESIDHLDLGGMIFNFSATDHQGSKAVFLTVVREGLAQPLH
jgi:ABC-type branched-subunit amino acid transport system substrate-binding protein